MQRHEITLGAAQYFSCAGRWLPAGSSSIPAAPTMTQIKVGEPSTLPAQPPGGARLFSQGLRQLRHILGPIGVERHHLAAYGMLDR